MDEGRFCCDYDFKNHFNENNKTLTITNVIRGDSGEYICVATNNVNTVQSNRSTLNVQCKDTFA